MSSSDIYCPHCYRELDSMLPEDDVGDFYYRNNLFAPEEDVKLKCPECGKDFWVRVYETVAYEVSEYEP